MFTLEELLEGKSIDPLRTNCGRHLVSRRLDGVKQDQPVQAELEWDQDYGQARH